MFPELEHQQMHYVAHVCSLHNIDAQTRLSEFEGIGNISNLANYTDDEIGIMADQNSSQSWVTQQMMMGLSCTMNLKAVNHWVRKKCAREDNLSWQN